MACPLQIRLDRAAMIATRDSMIHDISDNDFFSLLFCCYTHATFVLTAAAITADLTYHELPRCDVYCPTGPYYLSFLIMHCLDVMRIATGPYHVCPHCGG